MAKTLTEEKLLENFVKDVLGRLYVRRMKYIYLGFYSGDIYLLSDSKDEDFEYCKADQTTSLLYIKDETYKTYMKNIFDKFNISYNMYGCIHLYGIFSLLKSVKYKLTDIKVENHNGISGGLLDPADPESFVPVFMPTAFTFGFINMAHFYPIYKYIFIDKNHPIASIDLDQTQCKITNIAIPENFLTDNDVITKPHKPLHTVLIPGYDILDTRNFADLVDENKSFKLCLWNVGGESINFGSLYEDSKITATLTRNNIKLFP